VRLLVPLLLTGCGGAAPIESMPSPAGQRSAPPTPSPTSEVAATDAAARSNVGPAIARATDVHVLQPGDAVRVTVWRKPEFSGEFVVAADSSLRHPLFQAVRVAGVPLAVAKQRVYEFLSRFEQDPQLVLEPLLHVTVIGEVRQPNLYALRPETTLSQAVAIAGGASERGRLDRVLLRRGGREIVVDLTRPDEALAGLLIRSGDQLVVERRREVLRDVVGPLAALVAAAAAIANVMIANR
jgi:polysaccharide export outer membrane protein